MKRYWFRAKSDGLTAGGVEPLFSSLDSHMKKMIKRTIEVANKAGTSSVSCQSGGGEGQNSQGTRQPSFRLPDWTRLNRNRLMAAVTNPPPIQSSFALVLIFASKSPGNKKYPTTSGMRDRPEKM